MAQLSIQVQAASPEGYDYFLTLDGLTIAQGTVATPREALLTLLHTQPIFQSEDQRSSAGGGTLRPTARNAKKPSTPNPPEIRTFNAAQLKDKDLPWLHARRKAIQQLWQAKRPLLEHEQAELAAINQTIVLLTAIDPNFILRR